VAGPRVIVLGGGTMGLASAWALARRGAKVTVLERFEHVHARGSHGGHTRIIRESYHEGASYVPIVREAGRLWEELSERTGTRLLARTGMVELGPPEDPHYAATIAANVASGVAHTEYSAAEARRRWPFEIPDGWRACHSPAAGYLRVGPCMDALRSEAQAAGAVVRYQARVRELVRDGSGVRALLESGELVSGDLAVVAAGAYLPALLPGFLPERLTVVRRALAWTRPAEAERAKLAGLPVWCVFAPEGFYYGFPWVDEGIDGFKLACHVTAGGEGADEGVDAETVDRSVHAEDLAPLSEFLEKYLPSGRGRVVASTVCLYTCTPSWDFAIDFLPGDSRVLVAGGFSGHGFKFAPAIGEMVADGVLAGELPAGLGGFSRGRHLLSDLQ
jgi:monomeric sarcosine oxidase